MTYYTMRRIGEISWGFYEVGAPERLLATVYGDSREEAKEKLIAYFTKAIEEA